MTSRIQEVQQPERLSIYALTNAIASQEWSTRTSLMVNAILIKATRDVQKISQQKDQSVGG